MIREEKVHQMANVIQTNQSKGMQTMDDSLIDLYKRSLITREDTLAHCVDRITLKVHYKLKRGCYG